MQQKNNLFKSLLYLFVFSLVSTSAFADNIWTNVTGQSISTNSERYIIPASYTSYSIDLDLMYEELASSPEEFSVSIHEHRKVIELPMPNGEFQKFSIVESSLMPDPLQKKFPAIKSYLGQGIDDKTATMRMSVDQNGFHAMILSAHGTVYIDPYSLNNTEHCISYYKEDFYATTEKVRTGQCVEDLHVEAKSSAQVVAGQSGDELRVYRAAIATTGEYTEFHGGTAADAIAAVNATLNRINGVYEREASFRLELVADNDQLMYTDADTDPYTNGTAGLMIDENQTNVDNVIGNDNYDIGHVFGKDSGGLAGLGVVCLNSQKGRGITGHFNPIGDPFDIDYVCHEMGHQFGGNHTQNNSCERTSTSAYEPGSASTIMGYAGICAPNLQNSSDDYYHTYSFDQITTHTNGTGNCAETTPTGNSIPVANAGQGGFTIPANTPFELIGSGNDADPGNELTYCWEEFDLGPVTVDGDDFLTNPSGNQPIFRSWEPSLSSTRVFPRLQDLLAGTTTIGELLPTYSRDLTFRLTVRDNNAGGGGVSYDQIAFEVSDLGGPFTVNNIDESWEYGSTYTLNWDVANTDAAPINCATVDIYLSTDGGQTFDELLAEGVPNNGSADIVCPYSISSQCRIKVKASDNIFFNITNQFQIIEPTEPNYIMTVDPIDLDVCSEDNAVFDIQIDPILNFSDLVNLSIEDAPAGLIINFVPTDVAPGDNSTLTISSPVPIPAGEYPFQITSTSGDITHLEDVSITVYAGTPTVATQTYPADAQTLVPVSPTFTWAEQDNASEYTLQIASDVGMLDVLFEYDNIEEASYAMDVMLQEETEYFWTITSVSPCGEGDASAVFSFTTGELTTTEIAGCMDETMFNYDPDATVDDNSCIPFIYGCTNPEAENYDPEANTENESCIIAGCTNPLATNFNPEANSDNGSCIIEGCTDPLAINYDIEANFDDGSCIATVVGCTDPEAHNYNPSANVESGECDYVSLVIIDYNQLPGSNFHFWAYVNDLYNISYYLWDMGDGTTYFDTEEPIHYYAENGTYQVSLSVYTLTGVYTAYEWVTVEDVVPGCTNPLALNYDETATFDDGSCIEAILGCTSEDAVNYNPDATVDDGSCIGVVYGCTDETAVNYNAEANIDDGSCEDEILGCIDVDALNYDENANTDDGSCVYPLPTEPDWNPIETSNNHIILVPTSANITINDLPIEIGDYIGVFYLDENNEYQCAGMMMWEGITNTMTVYGADAGEANGMQVGEEFVWMTWKASINEVRLALADYDLTMPNEDTYEVDGISALTALSNTMAQTIEMTEGWNLISTYIVPDLNGIQEVLAPIEEDLFLAKDEVGNVYWPDFDLNNIGNHQMGKAYKLKMNADVSLEVRGAIADPVDYPLALSEGWSYLGYLRTAPADIVVVMESVADDMLLIKDGVGNVYWPEYDVNTIGNMEPGKGYQVRMVNSREFVYPDNNVVLPELRKTQKTSLNHFVKPIVKELNMSIAIPENVLVGFESGDEFAVKNNSGEIIGAQVYNGGAVVISVFMDVNDLGEEITFSYWSFLDKETKQLEFDFEKPAVLESDGVYVVNALNSTSDEDGLFAIYPNPANELAHIKFSQSKETDLKIVLLNTLGEEVKIIENATYSEGAHIINISLEGVSSGVYFVKFNSNETSELRLLHVQK